MTVCAKANLHYDLILFEKYGIKCKDNSYFEYKKKILKLDIEGFNCKSKPCEKPNVAPIDIGCNKTIVFTSQPCSTC